MILKNKENKKLLSQLLCTFQLGPKIELVSKADCIVNHDEADITIISYMLKAAAAGASHIRVLSDDTDIFVLLVYWVWKENITSEIYMEKWDGSILLINSTVRSLGNK